MIGILMATYNGEKYIEAQLESIFCQTTQDFILYVQDDGSADRTFSIANAYAKNYPDKIICMKNEFPSGSAKGNFFLMLKNMHCREAEYILFADQDDVWKPDKLEKLLSRMRDAEKKYGKATPLLVYSDLEVVDENLQTRHESMQRMMGHKIREKSLSELLVENDVTGNSLLMNRALADIYFEPSNSPMHDWYLALLAKVYGKTVFLDEPLTLYRQHEANALGAKKAGFFQAVIGKLRRTKEERNAIQNHYKEMFAQAESILKHAERTEAILRRNTAGENDVKTDVNLQRHYRILKEFVSLQRRGRIGKMLCIFRNRFFKSRLLMTLGQLFSV